MNVVFLILTAINTSHTQLKEINSVFLDNNNNMFLFVFCCEIHSQNSKINSVVSTYKLFVIKLIPLMN